MGSNRAAKLLGQVLRVNSKMKEQQRKAKSEAKRLRRQERRRDKREPKPGTTK